MFLQKTRWIAEKQNIQWIDRPDRTGSDGAGIGNLGESGEGMNQSSKRRLRTSVHRKRRGSSCDHNPRNRKPDRRRRAHQNGAFGREDGVISRPGHSRGAYVDGDDDAARHNVCGASCS